MEGSYRRTQSFGAVVLAALLTLLALPGVSLGDWDWNGPSSEPSISPGGRHVVFTSSASNLVTGDSNGARDVFVYDLVAHTTMRISVTTGGAQANSESFQPSISSDGRYVAFRSTATNLVSGDTNGADDVFVRDLTAGTTTRVSVGSGGAQANSESFQPAISSDGRYVAFRSTATNLVSGDTNGADDVFVRDLTAGTTTRVSVDSGGREANGRSASPSISGNGGYVAFESSASNLVSGDTNSASDVFVRSLGGATTTRVSVNWAGAQASGSSSSPSISSDGDRVAYQSNAPLDPGDQVHTDVYVRDRSTNTTTWASKAVNRSDSFGGDSTSPSISGAGRYVAFGSDSDHHVIDRNGARDIYEYDLDTDGWALISTDDVTGPGSDASDAPSLSSDASRAAFSSLAVNWDVDTNGVEDIYLHEWVPPEGLLDRDLLASGGAGSANFTGPDSAGQPAASGEQVPALCKGTGDPGPVSDQLPKLDSPGAQGVEASSSSERHKNCRTGRIPRLPPPPPETTCINTCVAAINDMLCSKMAFGGLACLGIATVACTVKCYTERSSQPADVSGRE